MGWKKVKEHYRIEHIVHVSDAGICIGSDYVTDIIVINQKGKLVKRYDGGGNEDLLRYQREMEENPELLCALIEAPDVFSSAIPVYTYMNGEILEKACEATGWPNVTHDGMLMHENMFSVDKSKVIQWAKRSAASHIKTLQRSVVDAEKRLKEVRDWLEEEEADLRKLNAQYGEDVSENEE